MSRKTAHTDSMVLSFHDNIKKIARKNLAFRNAGAKAVEEQMRRAWGQ